MLRTIHCSRVSCGAASTRPTRLLSVRVQNARSGSSDESVEQKFNSFMKSTQPKLQNLAEELKSSARRTYTRLDTEYDLTERAAKAAKRVKETAKDVDQQYGLRRRMRSTFEQVQRVWPTWSRQFEEFSKTPTGKFIIVGGVFLLMTTPFFWRVVNGLVLLWWLALPIGTFLISRSQQKQAQQAAAEEAERRRNPFASMFQGSGFGTASKGSTKAKDKKYGGPVIDAEWRPLDEKQ